MEMNLGEAFSVGTNHSKKRPWPFGSVRHWMRRLETDCCLIFALSDGDDSSADIGAVSLRRTLVTGLTRRLWGLLIYKGKTTAVFAALDIGQIVKL